MKVFSVEDAREVLKMPDVIAALRVMYRELGDGRAANRVRSDTICETPSGDAYGLKSMDGLVPKLEVGSVRINSDVVTWPKRAGTIRREKVPAAPGSRWTGLILLFSTRTGEPLAITPDGYIQRMRVGGTSAIAVDLMARQNAKVLAIFGSGWQAGSALLGACSVRQFQEVRVYSPNREHLEAFREEMRSEADRDIRLADTPEELVKGADVVLTATNSLDPVLRVVWIEPGMHVGCVAAKEFEAGMHKRVSRIAVHTHDAMPFTTVIDGVNAPDADTEQGGWHRPLGDTVWTDLPTLADVFVGRAVGRASDDEVTCFINNIGLGSQFTVVTAKLLEIARDKGVGRDLPTEWFTQNVHP